MRKDRVFLSALLGYIGGVFVGSFSVVSGWIAFLIFAFWIALILSFPRRNIFFLIFPVTLSIFGIFSAADSLEQFHEEHMRAGAVSGIARVTNDPEERDFYRQTVIRMESCENDPCPQKKILWQAPRTMEIVPGARIAFSCTLESPKNFDEGFDYRIFCRDESCRSLLPKQREVAAAGSGLGGRIAPEEITVSRSAQTSIHQSRLSHIVAGYNIALITRICDIRYRDRTVAARFCPRRSVSSVHRTSRRSGFGSRAGNRVCVYSRRCLSVAFEICDILSLPRIDVSFQRCPVMTSASSFHFWPHLRSSPLFPW
jgi:hypothetical protein